MVLVKFEHGHYFLFKKLYRVSRKIGRSSCLISLATSSLESWDISPMKGDIQRYVLSTITFLCDIGKLRYRQNNTGYQNIKMVKYRLIPYS